ncbi:MAG TPA: protease complex subunit PrcB family protein [bacterium]|nr:protease complex subunit PrcB family protein [bacterium]
MDHRKVALALLLGLAVVGACHTSGPSTQSADPARTEQVRPAPPQDPGPCVDTTVLMDSQWRDTATSINTVFTKQRDFQNFWAANFGGTAPEVSFGNTHVVAIGLEEFPITGHSLTVNCVQYAGGKTRITYTHTAPGEGCTVAEDPVRPTVVLSYPKTRYQAEFVRLEADAEPCI